MYLSEEIAEKIMDDKCIFSLKLSFLSIYLFLQQNLYY